MKKGWMRWVILVVTALTICVGCNGESDISGPEITLDVRSEETYQVGEDVIRIHVTATDPRGGELRFSVVDPPSRARFQTFSNSAVFIWDPIASDVTMDEPRRLVFAVTNDRGVTSERTVTIHIQAGNTLPRFLNGPSELYDPNSGKPLKINVRVRDDDSPMVHLDMPGDRAPEGATFEQTDDFEGEFRWMPSPVQLGTRMHTVVFVADDEDNRPVEYKVTLIIQGQSSGPGGGNVQESCEDVEYIAHEPLGAQRGSQPYAIEGQILDSSQQWEEVVVFSTMDDVLTEEPEYEVEVLELEGDKFWGAISNPLLEGGSSEVVSYVICVYAAVGGDEGVICTPWDYFYQFIAYTPDDMKCRDDGLDMATPDRASSISMSEWKHYRVCEEKPKYHMLELEEGEAATVYLSYSPGLDVEMEVQLDDQHVVVEHRSCEGLSVAHIEGPARAMVRVEGDDFPYHIRAYADTPECPGDEYEPNNTPGQATMVWFDSETFSEMAICTQEDRDVFAIELVRGDELDAYLNFEHGAGDLDMTLFAPSQVEDVVAEGNGVAQGWSTTDDELIYYVAEESGFYYLSVVTSDRPNSYWLEMERNCVVDDEFAGNHSMETAFSIELTWFSDVKLCENQPAWFAHEHLGPGTGRLWGEFHPIYGNVTDLEVTIHDSTGAVVHEGEVNGNRVDFEFEPQAGELYYFKVQSDRAMIYDFAILDFS